MFARIPLLVPYKIFILSSGRRGTTSPLDTWKFGQLYQIHGNSYQTLLSACRSPEPSELIFLIDIRRRFCIRGIYDFHRRRHVGVDSDSLSHPRWEVSLSLVVTVTLYNYIVPVAKAVCVALFLLAESLVSAVRVNRVGLRKLQGGHQVHAWYSFSLRVSLFRYYKAPTKPPYYCPITEHTLDIHVSNIVDEKICKNWWAVRSRSQETNQRSSPTASHHRRFRDRWRVADDIIRFISKRPMGREKISATWKTRAPRARTLQQFTPDLSSCYRYMSEVNRVASLPGVMYSFSEIDDEKRVWTTSRFAILRFNFGHADEAVKVSWP